GLVRRAAASARETNPQSMPTAVHSASCQQLRAMLLCRISACLEAESIYETSSRRAQAIHGFKSLREYIGEVPLLPHRATIIASYRSRTCASQPSLNASTFT